MCCVGVLFLCVMARVRPRVTLEYVMFFFVFFFNDTAPTAIYTLSLHDALPISLAKDPAIHDILGFGFVKLLQQP